MQVPRPRLAASDWNLRILNSSTADQGVYECQVLLYTGLKSSHGLNGLQVNTEPKINYKLLLSVTGQLCCSAIFNRRTFNFVTAKQASIKIFWIAQVPVLSR